MSLLKVLHKTVGHFIHTNVDTVIKYPFHGNLPGRTGNLGEKITLLWMVSNGNYSQLGIACIIYNLG